ncbi:MAG: hypothetical protein DRO12_03345, partial [Thermoprotei archaeon]
MEMNGVGSKMMTGQKTPYIDHGEQSSELEHKLNILRALDSEIDFGRGFLQLELVLKLAEADGGLTPKELALALNQRYKAVIDALRK